MARNRRNSEGISARDILQDQVDHDQVEAFVGECIHAVGIDDLDPVVRAEAIGEFGSARLGSVAEIEPDAGVGDAAGIERRAATEVENARAGFRQDREDV